MVPSLISRRSLLGTVGGIAASFVASGFIAACSSSPASPTAAPAAPTTAPATAAGAAAQPTATQSTAASSAPTVAPTQQPAPQAAQSTAKQAVQLVAWAHWDQGIQVFIDAMKDYNFPDTSITIKKVVYPIKDVHAKMLAACVSGVGEPDMMRIEQGYMSQFLHGSPCFVDITPNIGNKIRDLVLGSAVDYWSWQGKIYGVGDELNACALAVRKSFLDKAKVATSFETWDDLVKQGLALKETDPNTSIISWHDQSDGDFQMLLDAAGGEMFDQNGDFGGMNDLGKSILMFMHDMLWKSKTAVAAPVSGSQTWSSPIYWESFRKDEIATVLGPPWHIGGLGQTTSIGPTQSGQWYIQAMPKGFGANKPTATDGGTSASIPLGSKNRDQTWSVIDFVFLTKAVLEDFKQRGVMVSYIPAMQDPAIQQAQPYYGGENTGKLYLDLSNSMPRIYPSPWAAQIHTAFQNIIITPYLQNQNAGPKDIDDGFAKLKDEIARVKAQ